MNVFFVSQMVFHLEIFTSEMVITQLSILISRKFDDAYIIHPEIKKLPVTLSPDCAHNVLLCCVTE